jgi:ribosomal-protein-alanine N-acetyltransferase
VERESLRVEDVFGNLPPLETERLLLRKIGVDDADDMFEYGRDPEVTKYLMWEPHRTVDDSIEFIRWVMRQYDAGEIAPWGMEIKETGKFIGTVGYHEWNVRHGRAEIGYSLARSFWGLGYMTEAVRAVIDFGFGVMGLNRVEANCFIENKGSARVMEKCGMKFEAILRQHLFVKGRYEDVKMYSILRREWAGDGLRRVVAC